MAPRSRITRRSGTAAPCLLALVALVASPARGAEVITPEATLVVEPRLGAEPCATEAALAARLRARLTTPAAPPGTLLLRVALHAEAGELVATVEATGRKEGTRVLRANGPECAALEDALVVLLLLLVDADPTAAVEGPWLPVAGPPPPPAAPPPSPSSAPPATRPAPPVAGPEPALDVSVWASLGGAVTHGLPLSLSAAVFAEGSVRLGPLDLGLGALWGPPKEADYGPGVVDVSLWGGRFRACFAPFDQVGVRVSGCGALALLSLRGDGSGFDTNADEARPLWLAGLGPDVRFSLLPGLTLGVSGLALLPVRGERFVIGREGADPDVAYATDLVTVFVGVDVSVQIW